MFENINYVVINILFVILSLGVLIFIGIFLSNVGLGLSNFLSKYHYKYASNIKDLMEELEKDTIKDTKRKKGKQNR